MDQEPASPWRVGHNAEVGKHSGVRPDTSTPSTPRGPLVLLTVGVTATLVAWGVLVYAAIEFGGEARRGHGPSWAFMGLATIGAAACLFTTLILGTRIATAMRARSEAAMLAATPPPTSAPPTSTPAATSPTTSTPRAPGRRRATR